MLVLQDIKDISILWVLQSLHEFLVLVDGCLLLLHHLLLLICLFAGIACLFGLFLAHGFLLSGEGLQQFWVLDDLLALTKWSANHGFCLLSSHREL